MGDMARVTGTAENTMGKYRKIKQIWFKPKSAMCTDVAMVNAAKVAKP